jgi:hypothetical protein
MTEGTRLTGPDVFFTLRRPSSVYLQSTQQVPTSMSSVSTDGRSRFEEERSEGAGGGLGVGFEEGRRGCYGNEPQWT